MTKREREYHSDKKAWKSFIKLSTEPGGPHYFYHPSLKPQLDCEPQDFYIDTSIPPCSKTNTEQWPIHGIELTNSKGQTETIIF